MGTNVDPVCGDDKTYLEKIAGGGVTPRYLGTYQTLAALKADWPDSMGASMNGSWAVASGTQYTYGGAGVGWVMGGGIPHFSGGFLTLPSVASDGDLATIPQLGDATASIKMIYSVSKARWVVAVGETIFSKRDFAQIVMPVISSYNFPISGSDLLVGTDEVWEILASARVTGGSQQIAFGGSVGDRNLGYDTVGPINSSIRGSCRQIAFRSPTSVDLVGADYSANNLMSAYAITSKVLGVRMQVFSGDVTATIVNTIVRRIG